MHQVGLRTTLATPRRKLPARQDLHWDQEQPGPPIYEQSSGINWQQIQVDVRMNTWYWRMALLAKKYA